MPSLTAAIHAASGLVWGPWTVAILLGTGIYLSVRLKFVQVRRLREAFASVRPTRGDSAEGVLSPFQAFATALASSVGTGNIAGVATAIVSGGPGALFWLWCYGFFATAIKFTEAVLGLRFRVVEGGRVASGPMYYLRDGLGAPRLALAYALVAGVAALTTTPFTQPNSVAVVFESQLAVPTWVSGAVLAVLTWLVVIGGIGVIGRTMERLAPFKVALYLIGGVVVILTHLDRVPEALASVFREAFTFDAAGGGALGAGIWQAMRYGLARGIYANEAGYGTAAVAYGTARSRTPRQQGLAAVVEVFVVSFVTSTISAFTILVSGVWNRGATSTAVVAEAYETAVPGVGGLLVAACAFLFGYTTLIGWAYYGEQFLEYFLGRRVSLPYRWAYCGLVVFGATAQVETVWAWGDLMNGLQIFPNVIGLVGLVGFAVASLKDDASGPGRRVVDSAQG